MSITELWKINHISVVFFYYHKFDIILIDLYKYFRNEFFVYLCIIVGKLGEYYGT